MIEEVLPSVYILEGPINVDELKALNVKIIITNKLSAKTPPEFKNFKVVCTDIVDSKNLFKLVSTVHRLYTSNIACMLSFDKDELKPVLIGCMMMRYCKISDIDEIDELLYMNYKITLSSKQKDLLHKLSVAGEL